MSNLNATDTIRIQGSNVFNLVYDAGNGNAGNIDISTGSLFLSEQSFISASVGGTGSAGNLTINARDVVSLDGSGVFSIIFPGRTGRAKDIQINAGTLLVKNGGQISASTLGIGNAGNIVLNVEDQIVVDGFNPNQVFSSFIRSSVGDPSSSRRNAIGQGGNILINTGSLTVTNGADVRTSVYGTGKAGDITINARDRVIFDGFDVDTDISSSVSSGLIGSGQGGNISISTGTLTVSNFARLGADTSGNGNAGNILLNARDSITVNSFGTVSSNVQRNGRGDGGSIRVVTGNLEVADGAFLRTDTFGNGNAGGIVITARDQVIVRGDETTIDSRVRQRANGNGGDIQIFSNTLELFDGAQLVAASLGNGNAGNVVIEAKDYVSLKGSDAVTSSNTLITSTIGVNEITDARGTGGTIQIAAGSLDVLNSQIAASTFGIGNAGNVVIQVRDRAVFRGDDTIIASRVEDTGRGQGGNIQVIANAVEVLDDAALNASTLGTGDSGNVTIEARDRILFDFSSVFSVARGITQDATGRGGDIQISGNQVEIRNQSIVSSSTSSAGDGGEVRIAANTLRVGSDAEISASARRGRGSAGDVVIEVEDSFVVDSGTVTSRVESESLGQGGDIRIRAGVLDLINNAFLDASTSGGGSAGSILINAKDQLSVNNSRIEVFSDSFSNAGNITITTPTVKLNRGTISAESATVDGGNINLNVGRLLLMRDGSLISATAGTAQTGGNGGNITINAPEGFIVGVKSENSDITANAFTGSGGRVNITAQGVFGLEFRPRPTEFSDITASSTFGGDGVVTLNTLNADPNRGLVQLPQSLIDTNRILANGCIVRDRLSGGIFLITGTGGLPIRPGDPPLPTFPTGDVQGIAKAAGESESKIQNADPIVEAQGIYRLPDGQMVLSWECSQ